MVRSPVPALSHPQAGGEAPFSQFQARVRGAASGVFLCTCGSGLGAAVMLCYSAPLGKKIIKFYSLFGALKKTPRPYFKM